jgi:hypothetical protein
MTITRKAISFAVRCCFDVQRANVQRSTYSFNVRRSFFNIPTFDVRRLTFDAISDEPRIVTDRGLIIPPWG